MDSYQTELEEIEEDIIPEPTNAEKLKGVPWTIAFNVANQVFCQFTFFGSVFVLFLGELGLSKTQIGLFIAVISFTDLIALFMATTVARWGYKRTFLTSFGLRSIFTIFLILTPGILAFFGTGAVPAYVAGVIVAFSIARSVGITALMPWQQERIPNSIRGKYTATNNIFTSIAGLLAVSVAGYLVGISTNLSRFTLVFAAGVIFGLLSIWSASKIPGGAPIKASLKTTNLVGILSVARDRSLLFYLIGSGLITLAASPLGSFLPLFMQEKVGLSPGNIVWLQTGTLLGGLISGYLWGWAADRYGSRPVMIYGVFFLATIPVMWLLMPRMSSLSFYAALSIAFFKGTADLGWSVGSSRLLYVKIVPTEKKMEYMAFYNAWVGIVTALSQLVGGRILDYTAGLNGHLGFLPIDSYSILFVAGLILPVVSLLFLRGVRADSRVTMGEFAGLFTQGNPFTAMESMIRFYRAKDEPATIYMTERLGQANSPLTVDELLAALSDPRFYVRFEALVSIARRGPDDHLMNALIKVLEGNDPALSVIAAWAMGRLGDPRALPHLRKGLKSRYRSVQAHAARSLGTLGDKEAIPLLLDRLEYEEDSGLQIAFACTLGKLGEKGMTPRLLALLEANQDPDVRMELALALGRIVGDENNFIHLMRAIRHDPGTATCQALDALKSKLAEFQIDDMEALVNDCAAAFSRNEFADGAPLLARIIRLLLLAELDQAAALILQSCARWLEESDIERIECLILALHTLGSISRSTH